jgi:5-(carboxyamino)imidazole ribonucleotide synthase
MPLLPLNPTKTTIMPGQTLGILGAGQLAKMTAMAAQQMGYQVRVYAPERDAPASSVCHQHIVAAYTDFAALNRFARTVDVVTLEFENIPAEALAFLASYVPVRPGMHVLSTTQHRIREKTFIRQCGFPVTPFSPIYTTSDLSEAIAQVGLPAILKTAASGYDGKGQRRVTSLTGAEEAFTDLGNVECVLESFITLEQEVSVLVARSPEGEIRCFPMVENTHQNHILHTTLVPASLPLHLQQEGERIAVGLAEALQLEGLLCVEFFVSLSKEGTLSLMVNELAPRPHNSGHVSMEACHTSQFEQLIRAVCNLPLGDSSLRVPAAGMINVLGDHWFKLPNSQATIPNWQECLKVPSAALHLYGKADARPGRKMGHFTATGVSTSEVLHALECAFTGLKQ